MLSTIYKTQVASGSISAGAALIDLTTANALIGGIDVSAFRGCVLYLLQGGVIKNWGHISATAPGGEALTEQMSDPLFDNTAFWTKEAGWAVAAGVATATNVAGTSCYETVNVTKGALIKTVAIVNSKASGSLYAFFDGGAASSLAAGTTIKYRTVATGGSRAWGLYGETSLNAEIASISYGRVTDCAITGGLILSTKGGARGWNGTGLDPNAAMTYKIYGEFKANGNAGYVR